MVALRTSLLALAALTACACIAQKTARVGESLESSEPATEEPPPTASNDEPTPDADDHASPDVPAPEDAEDRPEKEPPREAALARQALHESKVPKNHLSLAMAVSERASDLPWVMTLENRGSAPLQLAASPALLRLELTAPAEAEEDPTNSTQEAKKKEPSEVICQLGKLPKTIDGDELLTLAPGEVIFHSFDPRQLCSGETGLQDGWTAKLSYGFPLNTRKRWKGGKLVEEEIEQKAPFAVQRAPSDGDEILPLKFVEAEPFVLGSTYPLSKVSALPPRADQENEAGSMEDEDEDKDKARANGKRRTPPPPPIRLELEDLGTSENPELRLVKLRVRNVSSKSLKIFLRRELITYEVIGPDGSATCAMHPSNRAPDPSQFSTLTPGSSRYFPTRLAEACPPETWNTPGLYSVSARLTATASGKEFGLRAFTGTATTESPARLTVTGDAKKKRGRKRAFLQVAPPPPAPPE